MTKAVVVIFNPLELFPPSLNGLKILSGKFDEVHTISKKSTAHSEWEFPDNVFRQQFDTRNDRTRLKRFRDYIRFIRCVRTSLTRHQPELFLVYDGTALALTCFIKPRLLKFGQFWYHSHDVFDKNFIRTLSFTNVLRKLEKWALKKVDCISVPSSERINYYSDFKGPTYIIPNYPMLNQSLVKQSETRELHSPMKVIYQGSVSLGHGLEELILFVANYPDIDLQVTIIGNIKGDYRIHLNNLITRLNVEEKIQLLDVVPYEKLHWITKKHDIGWAVNQPINEMYRTGGTASNKIYEYCSAGLPTIYYNNEHYNKYLAKLGWTQATDLSDQNLVNVFNKIRSGYERMKITALNDHIEQFNYQKACEEFIEDVLDKI